MLPFKSYKTIVSLAGNLLILELCHLLFNKPAAAVAFVEEMCKETNTHRHTHTNTLSACHTLTKTGRREGRMKEQSEDRRMAERETGKGGPR